MVLIENGKSIFGKNCSNLKITKQSKVDLLFNEQQNKLKQSTELTTKQTMLQLDEELSAPIASLDLDEWFEFINSNEDEKENRIERTNTKINESFDETDGLVVKSTTTTTKINQKINSNLIDSIDLCNSLEDLVKTFDQNVKQCLSNYKDIDIGQLAPVQVRSQEDIINDSQIWYTLTGNFGNLLPIDYWSKSLVRKYHNDSLNISNNRNRISNKKLITKKSKKLFKEEEEEDVDDYDEDEDGYGEKSRRKLFETDDTEDDLETTNSEYSFKSNSIFLEETTNQFDDDYDDENNNNDDEEQVDYLDFDEDDDELRDQLDMHSMILSKSVYNENGDLDEPLITAEQVLNEIESMMTMQEEYYDEMTPDSGCYSVFGGTCSISNSASAALNDLPLDMNGSYINYINTFALQSQQQLQQQQQQQQQQSLNNHKLELKLNIESSLAFIPTTRTELNKLNTYELNEIIDQIESNIKELSDTLVQGLALRDELEFEKETKNTFISLLMSIQDKKRHLNSESTYNYNRHSNNKKKNRRSLIGSSSLEGNTSTHLTTIIPYNSDIDYTVQHLQILNKLLKAINEDSHQVPELLTNYILKVVCPT